MEIDGNWLKGVVQATINDGSRLPAWVFHSFSGILSVPPQLSRRNLHPGMQSSWVVVTSHGPQSFTDPCVFSVVAVEAVVT